MSSSLEYHGPPASFTFVFLVYSTSSLLAVLSHKAPSFCDKQDGEPLSFLWMVKKDPPSYLFGTIHVPYTRVWDYIPENAKQAFETCSNVFFELDLMDPYTVSALASCQMLPQGENLADVLPSDLYRRLKRHLDYVKGVMPTWMTADQRGRGMYADYLFNAITGNWERKRPVWVMLMVNSLTESDVRSRGVPVLDLYLAQEAERMNKRTGAVERVEEQCLPLNGLNLSQVLFALNHTLHQHEELREGEVQHTTYTTDDLIRHYNCGDLNAAIFSQDTTQVPTLSNSSLAAEDALIARNIDHYFRQELIYNRNMRMGNRVVQLMNTYPDESLFFAFGAGHFLGNNTVLDFVQARGFQVQHLSVNTKIRGKVKKSRDQASKSGMWAAGVLTQDDAYYDDSDGVMSFRRTGQRPNRRRPAGLHRSMQHPYDTTPTPTTPRPRRFNDLWVRLDSYGMRNSHMPQDIPDEDSRVIQNALHTWFGSHSNRGCRSSAGVMSIGTTIIFDIVLLQFRLCGEDLTGIT